VTPQPVVSSPDLAAELAIRLNEVAPDGFTVIAEHTYVAVRHNGEFIGRSGAAEFLESIEGIQNPTEAIERAARVILDTVQDYFSDASTEPWPGTRDQPNPGIRLRNDRLEMWFGDQDNPVLKLRPLDLATS